MTTGSVADIGYGLAERWPWLLGRDHLGAGAASAARRGDPPRLHREKEAVVVDVRLEDWSRERVSVPDLVQRCDDDGEDGRSSRAGSHPVEIGTVVGRDADVIETGSLRAVTRHRR